MWVTKAEIGDRELRDIFLAFGSGYLGRPFCVGKHPQTRRDPRGACAVSSHHALYGAITWPVYLGAGLGLVCRPVIVGHTSVSFHYFHVLYTSDMNSILYIIINTCFDIDLTRPDRRKPHHLVPIDHLSPAYRPLIWRSLPRAV